MGLRDAAASIPAKPIIGIALAVTLATAGWHGWTLHGVCTHRAALSDGMRVWASDALAKQSSGQTIETATDFDWDVLRISQGSKGPLSGQNCPFGWHWDNALRTSMAEAGQLTLIGFFKSDRLVEIVDFDRAWAQFETDGKAVERRHAIFEADPGSGMLRLSDAK